MADLNTGLYGLGIQELIDGAYVVALPILNKTPTFDQINQSVSHLSWSYLQSLQKGAEGKEHNYKYLPGNY